VLLVEIHVAHKTVTVRTCNTLFGTKFFYHWIWL